MPFRAALLLSQRAQAGERVEAPVAIPGLVVGRRVEQEVPVFGGEEEDEAVDQPEDLAVVLLFVELAGLQRALQLGVVAVG